MESRIAGIDGAMPDPEETNGSGATAFASTLARASVPRTSVEALVEREAAKANVDPALVRAIIENESAFDPNATSATGAQGLMQLEPATARALGVGNPYDPAENIYGGTRYIAGLLERFHGDVRLAVAAYNAGPGAVAKYGGVPPYSETRTYVERVLASYRHYGAKVP